MKKAFFASIVLSLLCVQTCLASLSTISLPELVKESEVVIIARPIIVNFESYLTVFRVKSIVRGGHLFPRKVDERFFMQHTSKIHDRQATENREYILFLKRNIEGKFKPSIEGRGIFPISLGKSKLLMDEGRKKKEGFFSYMVEDEKIIVYDRYPARYIKVLPDSVIEMLDYYQYPYGEDDDVKGLSLEAILNYVKAQ